MFFLTVCLKFNIPESRQPDIKVYDQSDTEVDTEVFEEIVKESPGTFRIMLGNGGLGIHSDNSQIIFRMRTFIVLKITCNMFLSFVQIS